MKNTLIFVLILIFTSFTPGCKSQFNNQWNSTKFIVLSHLYYLMRTPDVMDRLIEEINKEDADYVFILGDLVFENNDREWNSVMEKINKINKKVYHTPGNHDIYKFRHIDTYQNLDSFPNWMEDYKQRIGSGYHFVKDANVNLVVINTTDYYNNITEYLSSIASTISKNDKPNILMCHHTLWSPDQMYGFRSWAYKRFSWPQIMPQVKDYDHFFSGDQWNQLMTVDLGAGKKGHYSGIGTMGRPIFYVLCEVVDGHFTTQQKTIELPPNHMYFQKGRQHGYNCEQMLIHHRFKEE